MRWLYGISLVAAAVLWQPHVSAADLDFTGKMARFVGLVLVLAAWATWNVRTWRARAFRAWPPVPRYTFLTIFWSQCAVLVYCWAGAWAENMGWPTTIWLMAGPFILALLGRLIPDAPSAPPA